METKTKTFDAVAESRKWREATSRKLNAMTGEERLAYLHALGERVRAELRARHPLPERQEAEAAAGAGRLKTAAGRESGPMVGQAHKWGTPDPLAESRRRPAHACGA